MTGLRIGLNRCVIGVLVLSANLDHCKGQFEPQTNNFNYQPFYVNCDEQNITDYTVCKNYIGSVLADYVLSGNYRVDVIPAHVENFPLNVNSWMTFASITDVSELAGTFSASVYLDMIWPDVYLTWNSSVCLGVENVYVDNSLVYVPDLFLYNAVGDYSKMLSKGLVDWHSDGTMWYSRVGGITWNCQYDLTDFPADTQTCTARFGSLLYPAYALTFSSPEAFMADDAPTNVSSVIVQDNFLSDSSWDVKSVSGESEMEVLYDTDYSFIHWTVQIKRYPQFYLATAVVPETVVCIIAILAFWVSDLAARLTLSITALLTTMTIQWSVSSTLPVSREFTWMSKYSVICIVIVALCVAETCGVAYMRLKTGVVPHWLQFIVSVAHNCRKLYRILTCHCGAGAVTVKKRNTVAVMTHQARVMQSNKNTNSPKHNSTGTPRTIESLNSTRSGVHHQQNNSTIGEVTSFAEQHHPLPQKEMKSLDVEMSTVRPSEMTELSQTAGGEDDEEGLIRPHTFKVRDLHILDEMVPLFTSAHWTSGDKHIELTWEHGAAALDDWASVLFSVGYFIVLVVMIFANKNFMEPP